MTIEDSNTKPRLVLDTLRFVFVSPQMLAAVIVLVLPVDDVWSAIGKELAGTGGITPALLVGIPGTLLATTVGLFWKTVFPSRNAHLLRGSPVYLSVRNRALFAVGLCFTAVLVVLVCLLVGSNWEPRTVGLVYGLAVTLSAVTTCAMFLAAYKVKELLDSYDDASPPPARA